MGAVTSGDAADVPDKTMGRLTSSASMAFLKRFILEAENGQLWSPRVACGVLSSQSGRSSFECSVQGEYSFELPLNCCPASDRRVAEVEQRRLPAGADQALAGSGTCFQPEAKRTGCQRDDAQENEAGEKVARALVQRADDQRREVRAQVAQRVHEAHYGAYDFGG